MIKASATSKEGRKMMLLGLSKKNVEKLMEGLPIQFDMSPFGFEGLCVIVGGETEDTITDQLKEAGFTLPEATTP